MRDDFVQNVQSGDPRTELEAIRDLLAHELSGHRCNSCEMLKLRTGDTAALVLRLQKVLEELRAIPNVDAEVSDLERIRQARRAAGGSKAKDPEPSVLGTKSAPRRSSGRTPRFTGAADS